MCDVLHQCEYKKEVEKVIEAETLKYGFTDIKVPEKVYALDKDSSTGTILNTARAEGGAQRHMGEVENVRREYMNESRNDMQ